jgi:hypothetical protein
MTTATWSARVRASARSTAFASSSASITPMAPTTTPVITRGS